MSMWKHVACTFAHLYFFPYMPFHHATMPYDFIFIMWSFQRKWVRYWSKLKLKISLQLSNNHNSFTESLKWCIFINSKRLMVHFNYHRLLLGGFVTFTVLLWYCHPNLHLPSSVTDSTVSFYGKYPVMGVICLIFFSAVWISKPEKAQAIF